MADGDSNNDGRPFRRIRTHLRERAVKREGDPSPPAHLGRKVGYCMAPIEHRFQPGVSGNPAGRPKGSKNRAPNILGTPLWGAILAEGNREVRLHEHGLDEAVPAKQAVLWELSNQARSGKIGAARLFLKLVETAEAKAHALQNETLEKWAEYQVQWTRELAWRKLCSSELPDPVPHPDDIVLDWVAGTVSFTGPATVEEKEEWDKMHQRLVALERAIATSELQLRKSRSPAMRDILKEEIIDNQRMRDLIVSRLGRPKTRA